MPDTITTTAAGDGVGKLTAEQRLAALDRFAHTSLLSPPRYDGTTEGWAEGAERGWTHAMIEVRQKIEALWPEIHDWTIAQAAALAAAPGAEADGGRDDGE